ncbi:MAG: flagellar filament capping protein FliD [Bacillota bacterium]|nr:flagellar filament capping protein FliD [Bacillota bacterium]
MFRIGGIASGMDIDTMVRDLMKAERMPVDKVFQKKVLSEWRRDEYRAINTKLLSFRDATFNMRLQSTYNSKAAKTSNSSILTATTTGSSQEGTYEIKVDNLAKTASLISQGSLSVDPNNKIDPTKTLASQASKFSGEIPTEPFTFSLNGKSFTVDPGKESLNGVLDKINKDTSVGVNAFYDSHTDKVVLTTKSTGESAKISILDGTEGDFLITALALGNRVEPAGITGETLTNAADAVQAYSFSFGGGLVTGDTFTIGDYTLTVGEDSADAAGSATWFVDALNNDADLSQLWTASLNEDGTTVTLTAKEAGSVDPVSLVIETPATVTHQDISTDAVAQKNTLTFTEGSVVTGLKITIGDRTYGVYDSTDPDYLNATADDAKIILGADAVLDIAGMTAMEAKDGFIDFIVSDMGANVTSATATRDGDSIHIEATEAGLAGASAADYYIAMAANDIEVSGTNAQLVINGLTTERESNTFALNGTNITLHAESAGETVRLDVQQDTDKAFNNIMEFVNKYNELIDSLNGKLQEEKFRSYLPLTDEQKDAMSDKEIEKWEERAKSGLLKGDTMLSGILSDMRMVFSSGVEGLEGINSLFDIGITTGSWQENGKLHVDENKLKKALQDNPDQVMALFTNESENTKEKGIARQLYNSVSNGMERITTRAGKAASLYDQSFLSNEIRRYDERIAAMEERLQRVEDRYWRQFTAMEKAMSQMNSQSEWLYQQTMSMNG